MRQIKNYHEEVGNEDSDLIMLYRSDQAKRVIRNRLMDYFTVYCVFRQIFFPFHPGTTFWLLYSALTMPSRLLFKDYFALRADIDVPNKSIVF